MFCIKTIVLMTLGFSVSFSIFRISYQTGKDNDAASWEISGFAGAGTWKIRKCIDTWNACYFRAMAETSLFYWAVYAGRNFNLDKRPLVAI